MRIRAALAVPLVALTATVAAAPAASGAEVEAKIRVPQFSQPCAAAAAGRYVWVTTFATSTVLRIDPRRNAVVGRTPVDTGACGLGVGAGSLWIEDTFSATVSRVSIRTAKRTASIDVGAQPYDATYAFGAAWATVHGAGTLVRIDPRRNRIAKRFPLDQANGVVAAFGSIWATGTPGVLRIDPRTNEVVARIPLAGATWTATGAGVVWITTQSGLSRIDPGTNTVSGTIALPGPLGDPAFVGGRLWVPRVQANEIAIVDPEANAVEQTLKAGKGPFVVTEVRGEAWVPSWKGNDVWRFRP
jgi:DNA-binding beta-propeller fold protein YncE